MFLALAATLLAALGVSLLMSAVLDRFVAGTRGDSSALADVPSDPLVVGVGRVPGGPAEWDAFMTAFARLENDLDRPVVVRLLSEDSSVAEGFAEQEFDIALVSVSKYLRLEKEGKAVLVASPVIAGDPDNCAMLVVRSDSEFTDVEELRGARAAIMADSLAGEGFARRLLEERGETAESFFGSVVVTDSQYESLELVARGLADAAFVPRWNLFGWSEETFRSLVQSPAFAMPPVVARSTLDEASVDRIRESLTSQETASALPAARALDGFVVVTDQDFAFARVLSAARASSQLPQGGAQ